MPEEKKNLNESSGALTFQLDPALSFTFCFILWKMFISLRLNPWTLGEKSESQFKRSQLEQTKKCFSFKIWIQDLKRGLIRISDSETYAGSSENVNFRSESNLPFNQ